jgi:hypothetical protein
MSPLSARCLITIAVTGSLYLALRRASTGSPLDCVRFVGDPSVGNEGDCSGWTLDSERNPPTGRAGLVTRPRSRARAFSRPYRVAWMLSSAAHNRDHV